MVRDGPIQRRLVFFHPSQQSHVTDLEKKHDINYTPYDLIEADLVPVVLGMSVEETVREHALLCYA